MLAARVEAGELPPLRDRIPAEPLVVKPIDRPGNYGGEWHSALLGPGDSAWLYRTVGYDQLMRWDHEFTKPVPNLAESIEMDPDGREFTISLRSGIKWSDGEPFTADDILFAYQDILSNEELPVSVPSWLTADGEPATFEKIDDLTMVVRFASPRGLFLSHLAAPEGNTLTAWPRHYYEQYHADYNEDVDSLASQEGVSGWVELFTGKAGHDLGGLTNPEIYQNLDVPTLRPWYVSNPLDGSMRIELTRNPYYWKVDPDGRQLPYIDKVVFDVVEKEEVLLLKVTQGELDMHARHVNNLQNKPVLAQGRQTGDYDFFDVVNSSMNYMTIAFNLTHKDPTKREIFQNLDFRIGLSYALNREEMINAAFQRQGEPWQSAPRPESEFYDEELAKQYTEYDVDLANEHLDRAGYTERDFQDYRLGPDGERISFRVDIAAGFNPFWNDAMELVRSYWRAVGIEVSLNTIDRTLFYDRKEANEHDANVWTGDAGLTDAYMDPRWYLPFSTESNFGIAWANWYNDGVGPQQEPPEATLRQLELYDEFLAEADEDRRAELFGEILQIAKEEFYSIGTVLPVGDYGIVKNTFHNVPESMPGAWVFPHPAPINPEQYYMTDV